MNSPLEQHKDYEGSSVFTAEGLLREARRQNNIPLGSVPEICLLDPDGDLFKELKENDAAPNPYWACYHTEMMELVTPTATIGVVGGAVGSSFAVLVAEELFASGCRLLLSVTSAGQVVPVCDPPYFVLIERALRDEGTSHHYVPPHFYARCSTELLALADGLEAGEPRVVRGGVWTTDAPFRETEQALAFAHSEGLLAVEMEAAALYAFAEAQDCAVLCFAHVTNCMATVEHDFEKGEASGNKTVTNLVEHIAAKFYQGSP